MCEENGVRVYFKLLRDYRKTGGELFMRMNELAVETKFLQPLDTVNGFAIFSECDVM